MNRRSFLKACGVGVVAPLGLVGKATEEVVPKFIEPVPVEDRVYGIKLPAGTHVEYYDDGIQFICVNPRSHFKLEMKNHA